MDRLVRYGTTEDGVRIAYSMEGEGPPLLVCPNFIESFSLDHLVPIHEAFFARLREGRQLIRFDGRGTGLSQREFDGELSFEAHCRDLDAVVNAAQLHEIACLAPMVWGPMAARYAATHPDRHFSLSCRIPREPKPGLKQVLIRGGNAKALGISPALSFADGDV